MSTSTGCRPPPCLGGSVFLDVPTILAANASSVGGRHQRHLGNEDGGDRLLRQSVPAGQSRPLTAFARLRCSRRGRRLRGRRSSGQPDRLGYARPDGPAVRLTSRLTASLLSSAEQTFLTAATCACWPRRPWSGRRGGPGARRNASPSSPSSPMGVGRDHNRNAVALGRRAGHVVQVQPRRMGVQFQQLAVSRAARITASRSISYGFRFVQHPAGRMGDRRDIGIFQGADHPAVICSRDWLWP